MKNGNTKIIEINGFRGFLTFMFIGVCLVAGFVVFPAKVAMYLWNNLVSTYLAAPTINIWQGLLLWAAVALTGYIASGKKVFVSFSEPEQLNDAEMKMLMDRVKIQEEARRLNAMLLKPETLKEITKKIEEEQAVLAKKVSDNVQEEKSEDKEKL